ncbi:MAG: hypothetical protein J3R72DRAFT_65036 [Linnemannia gamsii]|nr:MAG: hypothetical protein J3R72DRAFT_65036 [Linnemannia gamsii]
MQRIQQKNKGYRGTNQTMIRSMEAKKQIQKRLTSSNMLVVLAGRFMFISLPALECDIRRVISSANTCNKKVLSTVSSHDKRRRRTMPCWHTWEYSMALRDMGVIFKNVSRWYFHTNALRERSEECSFLITPILFLSLALALSSLSLFSLPFSALHNHTPYRVSTSNPSP